MHATLKRFCTIALAATLGGSILAGCGGGAGSSSPSLPVQPAPSTQSKLSATATIVIPAKATSSRARTPQWISPSTMAIDFSSQVNGATVAYSFSALTPTSPNCHAATGGLSCTVSFAVVAGQQQMIVTVYDNVNAYLASALATTTQSINVAPGTTPNFSFTLNGIVAYLSPATGFTNFTSGIASSQSVSVTPQDADGNVIPGNWDVPSISLSNDDSTHGLVASPSTVFPGASINISYSYNGNPNTASTLALNGCSPYFTTFGSICPGEQPLYIDVPSQTLYVANAGGSIVAFPPNANGNVAPLRTIPAKTSAAFGKQLIGGGGNPAAVAMAGGYAMWTEPSTNSTVQAPPGAGNTSPLSLSLLMCAGFSGNTLNNPSGIASGGTGTWVTNSGANAVLRVHICGPSTPFVTISGAATLLNNPTAIALDSSSNIYVVNSGNQVLEFASTASGNIAPQAVLSGTATGLNNPGGVAVISSTLLVANTGSSTVTEYPLGTFGNIAPVFSFATIPSPVGIAADSAGNVYVSSPSTNAVAVYNSAGSLIRTISGTATTLNSPVGVAIRP